MTKKKSSCVSYTKWGYVFILPFFLIYTIFSLVPLFSTFYNSFFENYMSQLTHIGPKFVGFANFAKLISGGDMFTYSWNTLVVWILGFLPQVIVSMILAAWFTDLRLKLKGQTFFKTVIYMPNLIMASAFSMLFFTVFSDGGPVNIILKESGLTHEPIRFLATVWGTRGLIALMNFLMWFGNTTIILMAGMMGIDVSLFEAAEVDGAKSLQIFRYITMPLLKPILVYVVITSLIGGVQMFDVPQILTNGSGNPNATSKTLIMFLNSHLANKNFGMAGALSVMLFIFTAILSFVVYRTLTKTEE